MYYQTIHQKKTTLGVTSRPQFPLYPFYEHQEMLFLTNYLRVFSEEKADASYFLEIIHLEPDMEINNLLRNNNIKFIIVPEQRSTTFLELTYQLPKVYEDEQIKVLQIY